MAAERGDNAEDAAERIEYLDKVTRGEAEPAADDTATHTERVEELIERLSS